MSNILENEEHNPSDSTKNTNKSDTDKIKTDLTNTINTVKNDLTDTINNTKNNLQQQITSNDTDIQNLQNKDTQLQQQITSNDNDISNLNSKYNTLSSSIKDVKNDFDILKIGLNAINKGYSNKINISFMSGVLYSSAIIQKSEWITKECYPTYSYYFDKEMSIGFPLYEGNPPNRNPYNPSKIFFIIKADNNYVPYNIKVTNYYTGATLQRTYIGTSHINDRCIANRGSLSAFKGVYPVETNIYTPIGTEYYSFILFNFNQNSFETIQQGSYNNVFSTFRVYFELSRLSVMSGNQSTARYVDNVNRNLTNIVAYEAF